ncbi:MAG: ABC transporter ATP-binding protein [Actinomycetia bacterium]|nr:ABC transporter ATP-binding protein [Actinomycetes bacterium]
MSSIEVRDLQVAFRGTPVLDGLDLTVPDGAVTAVLGRSGCGKTSLLRTVAGLVRPRSGEIRLGGTTVVDGRRWVPPEQRGVGIVPQEGALFPHLDVAANVGFGLRGRDRRSRVEELLALVGMAGTGSLRPSELSGGMQQRVAVARALSRRPHVVLLDEPFAALDQTLRGTVRADVLAAIRSDGAAALLVTHDQDEALGVADRVAVLRAGRIRQEGTPEEVYLEPKDLETALFVGEALAVPGTVTRTGAGAVAVDGPLGPLVARPATGAPTAGQHGTVVVRPEQLALDAGAGQDLGRARVVDVRFHGHGCLVTAVLATGSRVTVRTLSGQVPRTGEECRVRLVGAPRFFAAR